MTRETYVYRDGEIVSKARAAACRPLRAGPQIVSDIDPYRSIVTDEVIGGRRQHRDHLREHGCEEVGNEMPGWMRERKERRAAGEAA